MSYARGAHRMAAVKLLGESLMFTPRDPNTCFVCRARLELPISASPTQADVTYLLCPNCGEHRFTFEAAHMLETRDLSTTDRAVIAHQVRKVASLAIIDIESIREWHRSARLPAASECIDRLVTVMAENLLPGQSLELNDRNLCARIGCVDYAALKWVRQEAENRGLITISPRGNGQYVLTLDGWDHHRQLMQAGAGSRVAFMAMRFGDPQLNELFRLHLVPAVHACGFELRTLNGPHQTAGSIDNRMRVEIRTSRFLLCDLSHGNRGAYWEAGFAEGLGRPVFYLCRQDVLDDPAHEFRPHFDTRQQLIIAWDPSNPEPGMKALKNAIRATLPAEAKMQD